MKSLWWGLDMLGMRDIRRSNYIELYRLCWVLSCRIQTERHLLTKSSHIIRIH